MQKAKIKKSQYKKAQKNKIPTNPGKLAKPCESDIKGKTGKITKFNFKGNSIWKDETKIIYKKMIPKNSRVNWPNIEQ